MHAFCSSLTSKDFTQEKWKERHGFFKHKKIQNSSVTATCPKTSKVKASLNIRSEVLVNVGLFESNNEGGISTILQKTFWKQHWRHIQIMSNFCAPWTIIFFAILVKKLLNLSLALLKVSLQRNTRQDSYQNFILRWIYFGVTLVYATTWC